MLKLYVKDNTNGSVHEYGTNCHDALILQEDGSLHYENLQTMCGTLFQEEGYSFCLEDGTIPEFYEDVPYIDIGGIDAVPVVRCKDCVHMKLLGPGYRYCNVWRGVNSLGDDGYCNYGERKDN